MLKFTSKTVFKAIDVVAAFFDSKKAGALSLQGWLIKSLFAIPEAWTDGFNDIIEPGYSPIVGFLSGKGWDWSFSTILDVFLGNLPKTLGWYFK